MDENRKKIRIELLKGDNVVAQRDIPVDDDDVYAEPPRETGIKLTTDDLAKIIELTDEIKRLSDELRNAAHIHVVKTDELPF